MLKKYRIRIDSSVTVDFRIDVKEIRYSHIFRDNRARPHYWWKILKEAGIDNQPLRSEFKWYNVSCEHKTRSGPISAFDTHVIILTNSLWQKSRDTVATEKEKAS